MRTCPIAILDLYPDSAHVKAHELIHTEDAVVWSFAKQHNYTLVSKDADFHQRCLVFGHPPKLIYLRVGNCPTSRIIQILRSNFGLISAFCSDPNASVFVFP